MLFNPFHVSVHYTMVQVMHCRESVCCTCICTIHKLQPLYS